MKRLRKKRHTVEHDNVHRWLVSYADYMTLLFALFVVLYAMAMVNEKSFESLAESVGHVFQAKEKQPKNRGHGDDILNVNTSKSSKRLWGNGLLEKAGPELLPEEQTLSNISDAQVGSNLTSLETALNTALFDLTESGLAQLERDGDWLEIELNSGLLFPSGSASATNSAAKILVKINDVIGQANNFIRVRGYTDNQVINTEIISSNWELSVFRATAILRVLEDLGINPARMAIEGYGQYYPTADNKTATGRAKNRKVVIAISKYALKIISPEKTVTTNKANRNEIPPVVKPSAASNEIKVINLAEGGIRITTRNDNNKDSKTKSQQNDGNQ